MDLDYSQKGKLYVSMIKYLKKVFAAFPEKITTSAATPASDHLFEVRDESEQKLLPEEQARAFHHSVAQQRNYYSSVAGHALISKLRSHF